MKGVSMRTIRASALVVLDKLRELLTTEPARLIGYGFALTIYLILRLLESHGFLAFPDATFEQVVTLVFTTMASLVIIVESIRRFVYSPQTYIEDLSDEAAAAHELAHLEEGLKAFRDELARAAAESQTKKAKRTVAIGTVKADDAGDKAN